MKELTAYITEKLDIDKINLNDKFPLGGNEKEVTEFLLDNGFEKFEGVMFDDVKMRGFTILKNNWVEFADTSQEKITDNNPIFDYDLKKKILLAYGLLDQNIGRNTKESMELLNKRFGWK